MIKIQIKTALAKVLFEYEKESNTNKKTLEKAVKEGADLRRAYLEGADLEGAYLEGAYLNIFCKWGHYFTNKKIHIGCESKTPEEWIEWLDSKKEFSTKRGTLQFKRIEATIRAYVAYMDVMGEDLYKTE